MTSSYFTCVSCELVIINKVFCIKQLYGMTIHAVALH